MYHSIGNQNIKEIGAELYSISLDSFKKQMAHVAKLGIVPLQSLRVSPLRGQTLQIDGDSPCLITFDDGILDNYTNAYPVLKEFDLKAYFFILVSKIGNTGYMDWAQIKELKDNGMIIGSHGMSHRILIGLNSSELDYELGESKKILETNLGKSIDYISLPRGFYNQIVINKAKELGYKGIFTSNPNDTDGFKFGRVPVKRNWDLEYFSQVLKNGLSLKDKTEELIKNSSKLILGAKNYDRLRTKILKK
jgi:peptidoglycan/xylan/chitin deacetylase (PgdA/CDA1 family)